MANRKGPPRNPQTGAVRSTRRNIIWAVLSVAAAAVMILWMSRTPEPGDAPSMSEEAPPATGATSQ